MIGDKACIQWHTMTFTHLTPSLPSHARRRPHDHRRTHQDLLKPDSRGQTFSYYSIPQESRLRFRACLCQSEGRAGKHAAL
jgi:hypothetical protein